MTDLTSFKERNEKRGFVLVLTLALLSFLLLLVLALAASLRIETQTAFNNTQWNNARQNALLGLNVALGQLQELAGPDQRVTATAEILSGKYSLPDGHPYWTGVWNATTGSFEGWLTSDHIESESETLITQGRLPPAPGNDSVWMVNRSVDTDKDPDRLAIKKQPIRSKGIPGFAPTDLITTGNYSYWISDEGVKASALKSELPIPGQFSITDINRYKQLANRSIDIKKVSSRADSGRTPEIDYLFSFEQLNGIYGISENSLANHFHNVTPASLGVYANTLSGTTGGLKKDLSQPEALTDGSLTANRDLSDFLAFHKESEFVQIRGIQLGGGEPYFTIPLVVPEFALRFGLTRSTTDGSIAIELNIQVDLWNPFTLPVNTIAENSTDEPQLFFEITGLPVFEVVYTNGGIEQATYRISDKEPDEDPGNPLELPIIPLREYRAGEISNASESFSFFSGETFIDSTPGDAGDDAFSISTIESLITVALTDGNGNVLQEFVGIPFSGIEPAELIDIPLIADGETLSTSEMRIQYWFRFLDEGSAIEDWATRLDPRGPRFNFETNLAGTQLIEVGTDIYSGEEKFFSNELFSASGPSSEDDDLLKFFDLPTIEPLSVASLRHLMYDDDKPNFLGNPNAQIQNLVFDEWFFSTLPDQQSDAERLIDESEGYFTRPFLNPHTLIVGDTVASELYGTSELAENAMLFGAFNINCTSPEVWEMVLSGNDIDPWNGDDLENPFYRFSFTADRFHKNPTFRRSWYKTHIDPDWASSFTVGVREITDDQLRDLSVEIVAQILLWDSPSKSIAEFLNRGIIENAIVRTNINTTTSSTYENATETTRMPRNSSAFLNQADVLNTIAPFIQARSDTFRIRAYGDAINPVTGKLEGRAWCEAWVQRTPELVDDSDGIQDSATGLGRKFKVIHFKWLDESQI